ncbi:MAG: T9SS type A sorting domain-containing protein [Saprospiraceae bacterium]
MQILFMLAQNAAFKTAQTNLPLGKLAYISEEKAKLCTLSSTEQSTLDTYWADLISKISALRNLDSLRQSGASVNPNAYATALQQRISAGTQYDTYQQGLTTARQQKIQTLLSFNAGISTGPIIEANHKTVNQIVLQMLLVDSLASGSLTTLTAIAAQCPLFGGDAVYEARAIVSRLTGQEYDDVALCGSLRPGAGGREETSEIPTEVIVFPNPTTGQISWIGLEEQTVTVRVFNQLGQMVAERNTAENSLDLGALPEGVYHLQFSALEHTVLLNKSIVIEKR